MFQAGDLVSHKKRGYSGVVVEILDDKDSKLYAARANVYKIRWEHGEWMYEMEDQLKLEVKAKNT